MIPYLSHTLGLSREQRGLGRLKLAERWPASHVTRTPLSRLKGQRSTCSVGEYRGASRTLVTIKLSKPSKNENRKWVVFLFAICETGIGNRKTVVFLFPICEIENRKSFSYFLFHCRKMKKSRLTTVAVYLVLQFPI